MGRAAREKWNRRLRRLAVEEAERLIDDVQRQREEAAPPFSPVSFWADWFRQTTEAKGPAFALQVLFDAAAGAHSSQLRAVDWWPERVDRADVDELKARLKEADDTLTGTAPVAFVELLAETIAARGLPVPGDSMADGFSAAIINLMVAIRTEIELALVPPTSSVH